MNWLRLIRGELRKLTSTRMPWAFLAVLVAISATTAIAVIYGTDMDGTKTFISTAADQRSLMAFAANATMIAGLFGAIAVAREYGHGTVVPTFLASPRRHRTVLVALPREHDSPDGCRGGSGAPMVGKGSACRSDLARLRAHLVHRDSQTVPREQRASGRGDMRSEQMESARPGRFRLGSFQQPRRMPAVLSFAWMALEPDCGRALQ